MSRNIINSSSFFLVYFATTAIYIYINTYLPVLFFNVLNIDRVKLAFIQLISYSALFFKVFFAILSDKYAIKNHQRKPFIIIAGIALASSFFLITLNLTELVVFTIFLFINFLAASLIDVSVKGLIIDSSPSKEAKNHKIFYIKIGAALGSMFTPIMFLLFMSNNVYSLSSWQVFFSLSFIFLMPLLLILPFIHESSTEKTGNTPKNDESPAKAQIDRFKISFLAICIFMFLIYADKLYEFPLEPWLFNKFGEESFYMFSFFLIIGVLINVSGYIIGAFLLKNYDRKKIIGIFTLLSGALIIQFAFVNFLTLLILFGIVQAFGGIIIINLSSIMMDFAKDNKVLFYQIIASFYSIAIVVFIPLGTLMSSFLPIEFLFIISGIIIICSLIPLSQIRLTEISTARK